MGPPMFPTPMKPKFMSRSYRGIVSPPRPL